MYLENKPLEEKEVHTEYWRRTVFVSKRCCEESLKLQEST